MTKEELKSETLEINDTDVLVNLLGIVLINSEGIFFKKNHMKFV